MTVREFMNVNADVDVCDDVYADWCICFCGPMKLTQEGEEEFHDILDLEVEYEDGDNTAVVLIDEKPNWKCLTRMVHTFFAALAGYCSCAEYDLWFKEPFV